MDDDAILVRRVLAGELDVYAELVREHQRSVLATIAMRGVRGDEVEELAQEAFVVAYRRLEHFDQEREFGPWLRGIARNLAADHRRRLARQQVTVSVEQLFDALAGDDEQAEREEAEFLQLRLGRLRQCLQRLPERSRDLLRRRYWSGENAGVIAAAIGGSAVAVRVALNRVRQRLRRCIEDVEEAV